MYPKEFTRWGKIKEFFKKNPTAWEFAKYTIFSVLAGWIELSVFSLLNYVLAQ